MKIGIIGMGHPFESQYNALKKLGYEIVLCDIDKRKMDGYEEEKYVDYKDLLHKVDIVLISTPPESHFSIAEYFLERDVKVICEKPLVTKMEDLEKLNNLVHNNFYNILHFCYGEEVEWFLKHNSLGKPSRIEVFIHDPYMENGFIKPEASSLCGAYLDETINPLSAIKRLYDGKITFLDVQKKYSKDNIDFIANSQFLVGDIEVSVHVSWNDSNNREKYMNLIFEDRVIQLDSFHVRVFDVTHEKVLFESSNKRMFMHYYNGFQNINFQQEEWKKAYFLNKAILEGVR